MYSLNTHSSRDIKSLRSLFNKQGIYYDTDQEYMEAGDNLFQLCEVIFEISKDEVGRRQKLSEYPEGFFIEAEGRNCFFCHRSAADRLWYDEEGLCCESCLMTVHSIKQNAHKSTSF